MRVNGAWVFGDDNTPRPIISVGVSHGANSWRDVEFLLDTGADRTVLSANLLPLFDPRVIHRAGPLSGLGGDTQSVEVDTRLRLHCDDAQWVELHGQYALVADLAALDICVLGRDITKLFSVIVDWPGDVVALLREPHEYKIEKNP